MVNVLIVEDDTSIVELLKYNLKTEGYDVSVAMDGETAVEMATENNPDIILMDWMLPEQSGVSAIMEIRKKAKNYIPIIMLTAKGEEADKIMSLESGADDYMVKPFSPKELIARLKANLRQVNHGDKKDSETIEFKNITIDTNLNIVKKDGAEIKLGLTEYDILLHFINNPNKIYSREQLLDIIWGENIYVESRTVDVHMSRIRKIIGEDIITTVWGRGYKLS